MEGEGEGDGPDEKVSRCDGHCNRPDIDPSPPLRLRFSARYLV